MSEHHSSEEHSSALVHGLSGNLSPLSKNELLSNNTVAMFAIQPKLVFQFSGMDGSGMATELQQGNAIAMEQLELTRQQMLQSVALLRIEAKKLEVAEAAYYAQLRSEFVKDYKSVFGSIPSNLAADELCVHDSLYALSLIAKKLKTSYRHRTISVDLSMDIALVMAHGSSEVHEHLVTIFTLEYFLGLETSGTFQQELRTIVDAIAQLLAEQSQAKRLEAEAEAEAYAVASANFVLVPQKILNDKEWKNSFDDSGYMRATTFGERHAVLSTVLYHLQQGDVRDVLRVYFGALAQIAGVKVHLLQVFDDSLWFCFARKILREAGSEFATAQRGDAENAFLRLYPQYNRNVRFDSGDRNVFLGFVYTAYALHHGTIDMFPSLSRNQFDKFRADNMYDVNELPWREIHHCYLMATAPDYVEFIEALRPYYLPDCAKR